MSDQERYLQACIDGMWKDSALRSMLCDGFERMLGRAGQTVHFPVLRDPPVIANPPPASLETITMSQVTVTMPDPHAPYQAVALADIQDARAKLDTWHDEIIRELLGGPITNGVARPPCDHKGLYCHCIVNTASSGVTLTAEEFFKAYQTLILDDPMDPYGAPPFVPMRRQPWPAGMQIGAQPMPPGFSQGIWSGPGHDTTFAHLRQKPRPTDVSGCRERGCQVAAEYRHDLRAWEFTHNDFHLLISDRASVVAPNADYRAQRFIEWAREIHVRLDEHPRCALCGEKRDPDIEPIDMEIPFGTAINAPVALRKSETGYIVEACSAACATAYAMKLDMAREHPGPRTQRQRDQLAQRLDLADNTVALKNHGGITGSEHRRGKPFYQLWGKPEDGL